MLNKRRTDTNQRQQADVHSDSGRKHYNMLALPVMAFYNTLLPILNCIYHQIVVAVYRLHFAVARLPIVLSKLRKDYSFQYHLFRPLSY